MHRPRLSRTWREMLNHPQLPKIWQTSVKWAMVVENLVEVHVNFTNLQKMLAYKEHG